MSDYICMLKNCKRCWGAKADGRFMGGKGLGATDQRKMRAGARSQGQGWLMEKFGDREV
jgi:hypothetical protein